MKATVENPRGSVEKLFPKESVEGKPETKAKLKVSVTDSFFLCLKATPHHTAVSEFLKCVSSHI